MRPELTELPARPKTAIVGAGALGSYFGACLAHAGHDVHFLLRSDFEAVRKNGLTVEFEDAPDRNFHLETVQAHRETREIGICDLVLVGLKTTQNAALEELIPPLVGDSTLLVTVQNGLGNAELLSRIGDTPNVIGALCQIGVNRVEPGRIRSFVPGGGFVQLGEPEGGPKKRTRTLGDLLEEAGITVRLTDSLGEALWRKLMWNVPFNGLTVIAGGVTTDKIVGDPDLRHLSGRLMEELRAAATRLGFPIEPAYVDKLLHFTDKLGAYLPSSLLDFREGRELEVEAIFGEPLRRGEAAGIPMPRLETVYALLKGMNAQKHGRT